MRSRIVEPKRKTLDVRLGIPNFQLAKISATAPDTPNDRRSAEVRIRVRVSKGMDEYLEIGFPGAKLEVEVVLMIDGRRAWGRAYREKSEQRRRLDPRKRSKHALIIVSDAQPRQVRNWRDIWYHRTLFGPGLLLWHVILHRRFKSF
jgi:hypothetical protein